LPAVRFTEFLKLRLDTGGFVRARRLYAGCHFDDVVSRSSEACPGESAR
jgi:hypothetical protein